MGAKKALIPFPQANDFNKIYQLLCFTDESQLTNKEYLKSFLSLGTERQVLYYLSACEFLGVINHDRHFTDLGHEIREASTDLRILKICKIIVSMPIFGETYFMKYLYGENYDCEEIAQLIGVLYGVKSYQVCKRRASTVTRWLKWVESQKA